MKTIFIRGDEAKSKPVSYGLIEKEKSNGVYPLTARGRHFKCFADEDKKDEREIYMKANAYLRAKYWWAIALVSAAFGWLMKVIESSL